MFEHVLCCPLPETVLFCDSQLEHLETQLRHIQTPLPVVKAIMKGFQDWITPPLHRSRSPTYGSLFGPDILLMSAYYEQFHQLGWFNLSR